MKIFFPSGLPATVLVVLLCTVAAAGCIDNFGHSSRLAENEGKLSAYFLDVGQGDSTLFVFGNKTILIDAGEIDMGDRVTADLSRLGIDHIDLLVATHPHSDHIGGMQRVLAAFPVGRVLDSGIPHPSPLYEHFLDSVERLGIPYTKAEQGMTIDIDPRLRVLVLSPPARQSDDDPNANSIVLRISYGTVDFLMTGDIGGEAESALVRSGYPLDAEILKVGHHGSEYSGSPAFLVRVHPETAVISDGKDNPYGHPHKKTLDLLAATGARVYRTDLDGTVRVRTDGSSWSVATENTGNIWQKPLPGSGSGSPGDLSFNASALPAYTLLPDILPEVTITLPALPPVQVGNADQVFITETNFNAPGDDRVNLNGEWVKISNNGNSTVHLNGWTLSDKTRSFSYIFPAFILQEGSSVTVYTGSGMMNDTSLYMGYGSPVWGNSGDEAILEDAARNIIDVRNG